MTGLAKVVYSKTGPDYTLGIAAKISATILSTMVTVRGHYIASIRKVVSRSISRDVQGLAQVKSRNVGRASEIILSVVARGKYWYWAVYWGVRSGRWGAGSFVFLVWEVLLR